MLGFENKRVAALHKSLDSVSGAFGSEDKPRGLLRPAREVWVGRLPPLIPGSLMSGSELASRSPRVEKWQQQRQTPCLEQPSSRGSRWSRTRLSHPGGNDPQNSPSPVCFLLHPAGQNCIVHAPLGQGQDPIFFFFLVIKGSLPKTPPGFFERGVVWAG